MPTTLEMSVHLLGESIWQKGQVTAPGIPPGFWNMGTCILIYSHMKSALGGREVKPKMKMECN